MTERGQIKDELATNPHEYTRMKNQRLIRVHLCSLVAQTAFPGILNLAYDAAWMFA